MCDCRDNGTDVNLLLIHKTSQIERTMFSLDICVITLSNPKRFNPEYHYQGRSVNNIAQNLLISTS
jgi:hypothetical protein